jgi:hypothetical protein
MATKKFPEVLYVKQEDSDGEPYFVSGETVDELAEAGTLDAAVYKLDRTAKIVMKPELIEDVVAVPKTTKKKTAAPAEAMSPQPHRPVDSTPAAVAPAVPITKEKAQAALEEVFAAKGIEAARDLLKKFSVKRLQDLSADRFPEFIEKAKVVVAGGDTL